METKDLKLPDLFANNFFRIPDYQRGYAWENSQLSDLWEDLEDVKQESDGTFRPHFTGTISLQKIDLAHLPKAESELAKNGCNFYDVVDGQQRLTTLSILLFELIKRLPKNRRKELLSQFIYKDGKPKIYRFAYSDVNDNNNLFLRKIVFEEAQILPCTNNVYTNNLANAKRFFGEKIALLSPKALRTLSVKLLTALFFDVKYIGGNLDVQSVFETMNNRGKPLTTLEKLKNRLLFLTSKLDPSADIAGLSKTINGAWGNIYERLGANDRIMLNEDEFLSAHLTLLRAPADYVFSEQRAESKVFEMFGSRAANYNRNDTRGLQENAEKEPAVDYDKIYGYAVDISNFVPFWYKAYFPDTHTADGLRIRKIQLLNGSKEMKLFLAKLLSLEYADSRSVRECLELVEKIVFRDSVPGLGVMDERTFATIARALHRGKMTLADLCGELRSHLSTPCNTQALIAGFRNLFNYQRGNIGFHRWAGLKYFLFEYEMRLKADQLPHLTWEQYYDTSIEHIMPRGYRNHWQAEMDDYLKDKNFSAEERTKAERILLNSLGNLTIIQDVKNSGLGDNPWKIKKTAYSRGCFSEIEISSTARWDPWSQQSILDRGKKMLDHLAALLGNLTFVCDEGQNDKDDILFYEKKYL